MPHISIKLSNTDFVKKLEKLGGITNRVPNNELHILLAYLDSGALPTDQLAHVRDAIKAINMPAELQFTIKGVDCGEPFSNTFGRILLDCPQLEKIQKQLFTELEVRTSKTNRKFNREHQIQLPIGLHITVAQTNFTQLPLSTIQAIKDFAHDFKDVKFVINEPIKLYKTKLERNLSVTDKAPLEPMELSAVEYNIAESWDKKEKKEHIESLLQIQQTSSKAATVVATPFVPAQSVQPVTKLYACHDFSIKPSPTIQMPSKQIPLPQISNPNRGDTKERKEFVEFTNQQNPTIVQSNIQKQIPVNTQTQNTVIKEMPTKTQTQAQSQTSVSSTMGLAMQSTLAQIEQFDFRLGGGDYDLIGNFKVRFHEDDASTEIDNNVPNPYNSDHVKVLTFSTNAPINVTTKSTGQSGEVTTMTIPKGTVTVKAMSNPNKKIDRKDKCIIS